jgi:hypothetical protein
MGELAKKKVCAFRILPKLSLAGLDPGRTRRPESKAE